MTSLWSLLLQTIGASLTAVVLLCAKGLFREQLSPRWQYGVWGILALRILLPAGVLGRSLFPWGRVALEAAKTAVEGGLSSALCAPYDVTRVYAPVPLFLKGFPRPGSITDALFYLYAAGVVLSLLWFLGAYLGLRRTLKRARRPEPERLAQLEAVCARYGLEAPARIVVCPAAESAFVCGPLRPVLVLPEGETDDKVLLHELLHLKYGDVWAGVGMCVLRCLHWCNPFLWYCWDWAQNDCEALCDQRVLERLEGEERREYGKILLSMAGDRYARAPGTSSMANGGANIKRRITAIARFKRYPAGISLAAGCIGVVLGVGCLMGAAQAVDLSELSPALPLALAQTRLSRPTTPAGALDTYVKAVLSGNGLYLSMVTPQEELPELVERLEAGRLQSDPLDLTGVLREVRLYYVHQSRDGIPYRSYLADWSVYEFIEHPDGSYTGLLVLDGHYWIEGIDWFATVTAVYQYVRVSHQDGSWGVIPLSEWEALPPDSMTPWNDPESALPRMVYTAEAGGLRVELDYWYALSVSNRVNPNTSNDPFASWFSATQEMDPIPKPWTVFTEWYQGGGKEITRLDSGEAVSAGLEICPLRGDEAERWTLETAGELKYTSFSGNSGSGGSDQHGGAEYQSSPAAIAVKIWYKGQSWYALALPEGGAA